MLVQRVGAGNEDSELMGKGKKTPSRGRNTKGRFTPTHGAHCQHFRKRYTDARTREGKQLKAAMDALVDDLGGQTNLNAGQRLLLDTIQNKLIVILQIGKYVDQQAEIIKDGQLIPVLGASYLAYLNSLRLSLDQVYKVGSGSKSRVPTIQQIIQESK